MKKWKKYSLLLVIAAFMMIVTLLGIAGADGIYRDYAKNWKTNTFASGVFLGIADGKYPWQLFAKEPQDIPETETEEQAETEQFTEATEMPDTQQEPTETEVLPEDKTYEFTRVDQSYFDDAVFIGDSRMVGMHDYSGWDNATYYASIGMNVYDLFVDPIVEENGEKITIEEALKRHTFKKIYLMVGINEMGTGTVDTFMKKYEEAVNHLRELQPDAIIFVQGIMYVKKEKSDSDPIFNNPNIQERNDRIKELADNKNIFYIDINEVVTDETGNLNPEYTYDAIHLLGKYYSIWTEFLLEHGIVKDDV